MWVYSVHGAALTGSPHEVAALVAWCIYALLAFQRFAAHPGARRCAVAALAGSAVFAALVFGVGMRA